jgi:hypothetical protein
MVVYVDDVVYIYIYIYIRVGSDKVFFLQKMPPKAEPKARSRSPPRPGYPLNVGRCVCQNARWTQEINRHKDAGRVFFLVCSNPPCGKVQSDQDGNPIMWPMPEGIWFATA